MEDKSNIAEYYRGKSVFVTGGSGFVGKTLIEKLLYSCPDIGKIYLLIRGDPKGSDFQKRFDNIFQNPLFQRLKTERPDSLSKVVPVCGDLSANDLIKDSNDAITLMEEVSVVFHLAATIRFNEPLKCAMLINVEGTKKVLQLCRQMKNLKAVVHVSTAFVNPNGEVLEEKLYPFPMTTKEVYSRINVENFSENDEAEILAGWPNTYIFTKALSESIIDEEYRDLPLVIVRPSIVTAMNGGPLPGWLDNWAGAAALIYPAGKGFDRVLIGRKDNLIDIIPVDYVSNCIIMAATAAKRQNFPIFNVCTTSCNPINCKRLAAETINYYVEHGLNDLPRPFVIFTESLFIEYMILSIIWLLCFIGDLTCKVRNKTPRYVRAHSKLTSVHEVLRFFLMRTWMMKCDATRSFYQSLTPIDRKNFLCDPRTINWKKYLASYSAGIEEYLVKKRKTTCLNLVSIND